MKFSYFLLLNLLSISAKKDKSKDKAEREENCHESCKCNSSKRTINCYGLSFKQIVLNEEHPSLENVVRLDFRKKSL